MNLDPDTWSVTEKKIAFGFVLAILVALKLWGTVGGLKGIPKPPWWAIGLIAFAGIFFEPDSTSAEEFPPSEDGGAPSYFPSNVASSGE